MHDILATEMLAIVCLYVMFRLSSLSFKKVCFGYTFTTNEM